jgi:hypothetical protein
MPYYYKLLLYTQKSPEMNPPFFFSACSICQSVVVVGKKMMLLSLHFNPCFLCIIYIYICKYFFLLTIFLSSKRKRPREEGHNEPWVGVATHQSIVHWMLVITHFWMDEPQLLELNSIWFHPVVTNQVCKEIGLIYNKYISYFKKLLTIR